MGELKNTVEVAAFCLDVTEVTVRAYGACVSTSACSSGVGTMFNDGKDLGKPKRDSSRRQHQRLRRPS